MYILPQFLQTYVKLIKQLPPYYTDTKTGIQYYADVHIGEIGKIISINKSDNKNSIGDFEFLATVQFPNCTVYVAGEHVEPVG